MWYVYILKCSDNNCYVGHTNDLQSRILRHNSARATKWTACRLPVRLVYHESHKEENSAMTRERQIKKWSRAKKEALIAGDMDNLKQLSKRKTK